MDAVQFGPRDDLGYSRPPVTASYEDLRRQGLPEVLFVHSFLPEGVTICDVNVFAAMIEEAYNPPATLLLNAPDEDGSQRCRGVGNNGIWEWGVVTPGRRSGWRMTLAPERDGQRQAVIQAVTFEHHREVSGATLVTFAISTRPAGLGAWNTLMPVINRKVSYLITFPAQAEGIPPVRRPLSFPRGTDCRCCRRRQRGSHAANAAENHANLPPHVYAPTGTEAPPRRSPAPQPAASAPTSRPSRRRAGT